MIILISKLLQSIAAAVRDQLAKQGCKIPSVKQWQQLNV